MAITFDSATQFNQKLHFPKALIITSQMIYDLSGFEEVKISPLFLVMLGMCISTLWSFQNQ